MHTDVLIIGAGPAGLAAASLLLGRGLRITIADEQERAGGQFLRQPPRQTRVRSWLSGRLYDPAKRLLREIEDHPDIDWRFGTTVAALIHDPAT